MTAGETHITIGQGPSTDMMVLINYYQCEKISALCRTQEAGRGYQQFFLPTNSQQGTPELRHLTSLSSNILRQLERMAVST